MLLTIKLHSATIVISREERRKEMKLDKKIKELNKVVEALIQLALSFGTLTAVIKMIIESIR